MNPAALNAASMDSLLPVLYAKAIDIGSKAVGLIILWIIGRFAIRALKRVVQRALRLRAIEPTLMEYVDSVVGVLLNILLVVVLLSFVGIETTTFAGLLAAAGLAIGTAWSGLLSNFAAGAFLVLLRPFRKGDLVMAGGVTGTVDEIGMFVTVIQTPDNVRTIVGNGKIFGDTIQNYSANPYRRVDRFAQLAHEDDHVRAMTLLKARLATIPNVLAVPAPDVEILDLTLAGPLLAVRTYARSDDYWQVYFDTNRVIRETLTSEGFEIPATHQHVTQ
ncbi:MAG TPA: mechanosensitive ion channel family protein [Polyangiaceae bacterium]|jgi:small conductance mechanosensitive channel|nr:mechanosensitive ion channel family protein [Polyangiaceae bacterium]